jgi:hypothetical protein
MERIEDSGSLELLRRANTCFTQFFERSPGSPAPGPDEELGALLQLHEMLESVGALLDGRLQSAANQDVRQALGSYRENLVRLRSELAVMQESAVARRASLDMRREHLCSARAWCVASRAIS